MNSEELYNNYKKRSFRSCISSAYKSVIDNIRKTTRENWKLFLVISFALGLFQTWGLTLSSGILYTGFKFKPLPLVLYCIAIFILYLVISARAFSILNKHKLTWNTLRLLKTLPVTFVFLLCYAVVFAVTAYLYIANSNNPANIPLLNIIGIALLLLPVLYIFSLPLSFVYTKYLVEEKAKINNMFFREYMNGLRNWGFLFTTQFLGGLCIILFEATICLPDHLLTLACNISYIGTSSFEDPSGLPEYFYILTALTKTVFYFVRIYVWIFVIYIFYYSYQTIILRTSDRIKPNTRPQIHK